MKSRPVFLRAMRARQALVQPAPLARIRPSAYTSPGPVRPFSSTLRYLNEQKQSSESTSQSSSDQSKTRQKKAPEPEAGPPQSPFKVFAEVLRQEIQKNKAWQDNVKQLQGDVDKLADSAALKKAREVYERARITNMINNNPRIQAALGDLKKAGVNVSEAISRSLEDSGVIDAIRSSYGWAAGAAARATQPVRDTAVYKALATSVEEAFDDTAGSSSRYGGYEEKEARRRRREVRAEKAGKVASKRTKANPE